ncbi:hypothetical protein EKD04_024280 [Chloroflexales bacterium ZM16-3]|nr:hypothetical protein [Chloroflexales bacterium ZM16-3]
MRYRNILALAAILAALIAICTAPPARAINIAFRGGAEDHYWDVSTAFCKDGVRLSTVEIIHDDSSFGDDLRYSIVLSTTTNPLTQQLPVKLAGGSGTADFPASGVNAYAYTTPQTVGSAQSVVLERWEHGVDAVEIETDPIGDLSLDDDTETLSGTAANCTVTTPPAFDDPPTPSGGATLAVRPGTPISMPIQASDADSLDLVTLTAGALPAGASIAVGAAANPASATLTWTPTESQTGTYTITADATDSTGRTTRRTISIDVGYQIFLPTLQQQ